MPAIALVASLVSLAAVVSAQGSHSPQYGRFPCGSIASGPMPNMCTGAYIDANYQPPPGFASYVPITGTTTTAGPDKAGGFPPRDSDCVLAPGVGYYCGWAGAT